MSKRRMLLLALVGLLLVSSGCGYNKLQSKQQIVRAKWADIEVQLQRRADLVPNLFEAAKAAAVQEQQVFGEISEARSRLLNTMQQQPDRKSTRLNSSHANISYAVFCLKKQNR